MRRITATLAAALTLSVTGLGTSAALSGAQAAGTTTILSPADGAQVPTGTNHLTVQFAADDEYDVEVDGPNGYYWQDYYYASAGETHTFTIDTANAVGDYDVSIYNGDYSVWVGSTFTVVPGPIKVTNPNSSPSTFYPVVRDHYKDSTSVAYTTNRRADDVSIIVDRISDGRRMLRADRGSQVAGRHHWTWNGLNSAGEPVKPGRYRIEITGRDAEGRDSTAHTTVTATTKTVTRHATKAINGNHGRTSHRGNCYANKDSYYGEVTLDCWGGAYAQAIYGFGIPSNATNLNWHVSGAVNCCDRGKIVRTGTRTSRTTYRIVVKATYWRSYTVSRAAVTYSYIERL